MNLQKRCQPPDSYPGGSPSLYVHIPLCVRKCPYCGFYSEPVADHNPARLVAALAKEVRQVVSNPQVPTVYVGGGSPTCMPMDLLGRLLYEITRSVRGVEEFTVEANPGQADRPILEFLRNIGVNRLSLGGQSFLPQELQARVGCTPPGRSSRPSRWRGMSALRISASI